MATQRREIKVDSVRNIQIPNEETDFTELVIWNSLPYLEGKEFKELRIDTTILYFKNYKQTSCKYKIYYELYIYDGAISSILISYSQSYQFIGEDKLRDHLDILIDWMRTGILKSLNIGDENICIRKENLNLDKIETSMEKIAKKANLSKEY